MIQGMRSEGARRRGSTGPLVHWLSATRRKRDKAEGAMRTFWAAQLDVLECSPRSSRAPFKAGGLHGMVHRGAVVGPHAGPLLGSGVPMEPYRPKKKVGPEASRPAERSGVLQPTEPAWAGAPEGGAPRPNKRWLNRLARSRRARRWALFIAWCPRAGRRSPPEATCPDVPRTGITAPGA